MTSEPSLIDPTAPLAAAQVAALLGRTSTILHTELASLPAALLSWRPAPEEWCALEVVGHLSEADERGFAGRIRTILAQERPRFRSWDPSAVARARRDGERDPADLLAEFTRCRTAGVALVETLTAADLGRGGEHPEVGFLSVRDLLHEWVHHDADHLRQLLSNVQAYTWPRMGNAQRFSVPESIEDPQEG